MLPPKPSQVVSTRQVNFYSLVEGRKTDPVEEILSHDPDEVPDKVKSGAVEAAPPAVF